MLQQNAQFNAQLIAELKKDDGRRSKSSTDRHSTKRAGHAARDELYRRIVNGDESTEITFGTNGKARAYFSVLTTTGASHTVTAAQNNTSAMSIFVVEMTGETATPFDKSANVKDTASPFGSGVTATTTQANELIVGLLIGQTGSNPGTHAIDSSSTPTSGWSITAAAEELDGTSFFTGAIASVRVTATGAYQGVWTESGSAEGEVFTATFKEAAAGSAANRIFFPMGMDGLGGGVVGSNRIH
jgi:hypothetical protein